MKEKVITSFYWLAGVVHIAAAYLNKPDIQDMSKALLMPLLIYLLFSEAKGVITLSRLLLALGLVFSWGGDLFLIQKNEEIFFLAGLGMFLVAQLMYAYVMYKSTFQSPKIQIKSLIQVIILGIILLSIILPNAGGLAAPVAVYAVCILMMLSAAILRKALTTNDSYQWAMIGAVLFVLSDSSIAINKFVMELPLSHFLIMSTYIAAQYLIVKGILKHPGG